MAAEPRIDEATYLRLALGRPDRKLELVEGELREKPGESYPHNDLGIRTGFQLMSQVDWSLFHVRVESGRLRVSEATFYIPDAFVFPLAMARHLLDRDDVLESYTEPVSLVVEVWSPLPGEDDTNAKLAGFRSRGDAEIWLLHPFEQTLTGWRRQPDGSYVETTYRGGIVHPVALPGVAIDLNALLAGRATRSP